jgi:nicotinic acid mononucleotide adenylyltransferase
MIPVRAARHPASATEIRASVAAGRPFDEWLDPAVADHIVRRGLYRDGTTACTGGGA